MMFGISMDDDVAYVKFNSDSYGFSNGSYEPAVFIKCMRMPKFKVIRRVNGVDVTSNIQYLTYNKIDVRDKLDGNEVFEVRPIRDAFGNNVYWEAYT